jgi:hypothetical protein
MAIKEIHTGTHADDSMEDGYVRVEDGGRNMFMTQATYDALWMSGDTLPEVYDVMEQRPDGVHLIPRSVIEREAAREVELALGLVDPEPSGTCILPTCIQDSVTERDGFPLCQIHADLMQDWDDLVA